MRPVVRPMTVLAAVAPSDDVGWVVPARPPNTPNGFGPLVKGVVVLLPPVPDEPEAGSVLMLPRPPRERLATPAESCAPRSRLKLRLAITMRVSISTCGSG